MANLIGYQTDHGVAVVTLSDPPVNAYTHEMMKELDDAIVEARFDPDVHVIVITGAGERYFCCGADIDMLREADATFKYYFCLHANETLRRLEQTPKLCIAALNGHSVGGGFEIALACDIRIARQGPYKVGLPEVKLGVLPGTGGTQRLTRLVGKSRAMQIMIEGENFSQQQAIDWLVNVELYPSEKAPQRTRFFDTYRSYVINYTVGKDLVKDYVEASSRDAKSDAERDELRWRAFEQLLSTPRLPSNLRAPAAVRR